MTKSLQGTKTHTNLKEAFAGESQANRRYLYFAKVADVEGYPEIAGNFKETADGETGHAHGHLDYLKQVGDPATNKPIGNTEKNLLSAVAGETYEYETMYPGMAKTARDEGFDDIAEWFETLAKAEKSHAGRFQKMLTVLKGWSRPPDLHRSHLRTAAASKTAAGWFAPHALCGLAAPRDARGVRMLAAPRAAPHEGRARAQAHESPPCRKINPVPEAVSPTATDPNDARYWDARDLEGEMRRTSSRSCHGCRMCARLLRHVPRRVRARVDRDIEKKGSDRRRDARRRRLHERDRALVGSASFAGDQVPVHARRGARVERRRPPPADAREEQQRARRNGITLQDRALGEPQLLGALTAGPMGPVANFVNANRLVRKTMEATAGIAADFPLPTFGATTFERWLEHHQPLAGAGDRGGGTGWPSSPPAWGDWATSCTSPLKRRPRSREERLEG